MNQSPWKIVARLRVTLLILLFFSHPETLAGIYRWQDGNGNTHYGDIPPNNAQDIAELKPTPYDSSGTVATVIDGDTLALADGRRVRLLGIDAPEVAHHGRPGTPLGDEARQFLDRRLKGRPVNLQFDTQHRDRYNRLLAHVFLEDGQNVNTLLLEKGFAYARFEWPNLKFAEDYYTLEEKARRQGKGIWVQDAYQVKPVKKLATQRNRFIRLRGQPDRIEKKRRYTYLFFSNQLRVAIKNTRLALFREKGVELDDLKGHMIVLRGWLGFRRGMPYLKLSHPYQLEKID